MRARCSELEPELRKERKMTAPTRMRRTAERAKVSLVVVDALLFLVVGREGRSTVEEDISRMGGSWGRLYEAGAESSGSEYTGTGFIEACQMASAHRHCVVDIIAGWIMISCIQYTYKYSYICIYMKNSRLDNGLVGIIVF